MCDDYFKITTVVSDEKGFMTFRKDVIKIPYSDLLNYPSLVNFKKIDNGNNKVYKGQ